MNIFNAPQERKMSADNWLKNPKPFLKNYLSIFLFVRLFGFFLNFLVHVHNLGNQRGIWNSEHQCFLRMNTSEDWKGAFVAHSYKSTAHMLSYSCKDTWRFKKKLCYLTPKVSIHETLLGVWHFFGCSNTTTIAFKYVWKSGLFKSHGLHSHLHLPCVFTHPLAPKQLMINERQQ